VPFLLVRFLWANKENEHQKNSNAYFGFKKSKKGCQINLIAFFCKVIDY